MSLFRRALIAILGAACLVLATAAFGPLGVASADPPSQAQNDDNGNSGSPGPGHGEGSGQDNAGGSNAGGNGGGQGRAGGNGDTAGSSGGGSNAGSSSGATAGGRSDSNPDGGGLDKPDCETTAEGCQGPAPRDGNNGCGNEAEPKSVRDDDNNGNCGGGQKKDQGEETASGASVAMAAAQGAWTGAAGNKVARFLAASVEVAREDATVETDLAEDMDETAEVMGVTVERAAATSEEVDLEDLELARERSSRSGERSLLALTGMAMLTLLAAGLFTVGVGRLFRSFEGDPS